MKVIKKQKKTRKEPLSVKMKDCSIKLNRLSLSTIQRYIDPPTQIINCNVSVIIKDGKVLKIQQSGLKIPIGITVSKIENPKPSDEFNLYNLRGQKTTARPTSTDKKVPGKKCTTVAVINPSVRKNQLWSECKKARSADKLIQNVIVFAKQVQLSLKIQRD